MYIVERYMKLQNMLSPIAFGLSICIDASNSYLYFIFSDVPVYKFEYVGTQWIISCKSSRKIYVKIFLHHFYSKVLLIQYNIYVMQFNINTMSNTRKGLKNMLRQNKCSLTDKIFMLDLTKNINNLGRNHFSTST